jgi:hypothetical protein
LGEIRQGKQSKDHEQDECPGISRVHNVPPKVLPIRLIQ